MSRFKLVIGLPTLTYAMAFYFSSQLVFKQANAEQVITTGYHEENPAPHGDIVRNQQSSTTVLYFSKDGPPLASF